MKKMTMKGIVASVIIGLLLIAVISFTGTEKTETTKIGWIGPLSGDVAIIGEENLRGVQLAVDRLNAEGQNLELIVKDDQLNDQETITQYMQLVHVEDVQYVVTVTYGGFLVLADQAAQDGVILLDSLDTSEELADLSANAFAIGVYDESIGFAIADYLNAENVKEIGLINNMEDPFILLVKDALKQRFKGEVREESYDFSTTDFRTVLTKLSGLDNIVLLGWEETGRIVRQANELNLDAQIIGIDTFASEDFRKNANFKHEGLVFTFWQGQGDEYQRMLGAYEGKFGGEPDNILFTAVGYDAMSVLGHVLDGSSGIGDVTYKLRTDVKNFPGAAGMITMDSDGITRSIQESMHMYKAGEIVALE